MSILKDPNGPQFTGLIQNKGNPKLSRYALLEIPFDAAISGSKGV